MQSVRLHVAGDGQVWAISRCSVCGDIDKHRLQAAATGTVRCDKCGRQMDITGATVEAVDAEDSKGAGSRLSASKLDLTDVLRDEGLNGAMAAINQTVPHRYTGVFVKTGPMLRNIALHDKRDSSAKPWPPFPLGQSFCSMIIASGDSLAVQDAQHDARSDVRQHPAAAIVQSYFGVPLLDDQGNVFGTLCHFDEASMDVAVDLVSMLQIPRTLRPYLPSPDADSPIQG